ncbi:MAG: alpha/beta hydrolase [Ferruginibacter sp.]
MKFIYFLFFLFFSFFIADAQTANDWGTLVRIFNAKKYAGKKFKIEAAIKVQLIDPNADAELWVRVDKENNKMGFFYNMMDKPIRSNEWKVYNVSGRIDKGAEYLVFGGMYHRKGIFYFDEFHLYIETEKDKFEEIMLPISDFESDNIETKKFWNYPQVRKGMTTGVSGKDFYGGKQCFIIDASTLIGERTYGNNDSTGKYANVNGINIYYEEYGKGIPLLLLHGNSCSISLFEKQIPEFAKKYRVIAVDTRGQGKSSEDGKTYTYDLFADDMNALLDYLKLDSVDIVGWSDGGNTGLIMAMKYPKKVKKLVTMGACIFIDHSVVANSTFKIVKNEMKELQHDTSYIGRNKYRLHNLLLTEPRHSYQELNTISCPVLVVAGEDDIIKEDHTKHIAASIPKSTLMIVSKATHYFPSDDPAAFNGAVIHFLENE